MKRVLVFSFFPAFVPPASGGEQRLYWLYRHLSRFHDVTLLSHTHPGVADELIGHTEHFRELRIAKDERFVRLHLQMDAEGIGPECSALVCALAGQRGATRYHEAARELLPSADVVIHEFPYTLPFDPDFDSPHRSPRIYASHNLESRLVRSVFTGPTAESYYALVGDLERKLARGSDLVFATCEEDARGFAERLGVRGDRIRIAHNGFEPSWREFAGAEVADRRGAPVAVFLGSGNHPPNVEAATEIIERIAPRLPRIDFQLAGRVCERLGHRSLPGNVSLRGFLSEEEKSALLARADFGLNPVRSGGGTNLKMLEYLAAGLTVVTTPVGARGLDLEDGVHAAVHDLEAFPAVLRRLASEPDRRERLRRAGREHAKRHFTWAGSARALHRGIAELSQRPREHRYEGKPIRLLVLNDFPIAPGLGGGQVRIRDLYRALPEGYDVTLLCLGDAADERVTRIDHRFVEIAVPKTSRHRNDQDGSAIGAVSIADIVAGRQCLRNERLLELVREHAAAADVVVFEHPYLAPLLEAIPAGKPIVYSAANVEAEIKRGLLAGRPDHECCLSEVTAFENAVASRASLILAVTASDAEHFRGRCPGAVVAHVANGVDCSPAVSLLRFARFRKRFGGRRVASFIGSAHPPNVEAAQFIVRVLAPKLPDVFFLVVGSVCDALRQLPAPENVLLAGVVTREEKDVLQYLSDVSINPVISGGGSSLKVSDALAAGLPLLSTPFGARGFDADGEQGVVRAEIPDFSEALRKLLEGPEELRRLSQRGVRHARSCLDWQVLADGYSRELRELSNGVAEGEPTGKRLLVVTHRYTRPARGGAEHYLDRVLSELGSSGRWSLTVATVDATDIADHWHFSSVFSNDGSQSLACPPYLDRLYRFELSPDAPGPRFERCSRLFELWGRESRELGRLALASSLPAESILLGGWHFPEPSGASTGRWTHSEAEIWLPARKRAIDLTIRGHAPEPKQLQIALGDADVRFDGAIAAGAVDLTLRIAAGDPGVLSLRTPATAIGDDPRPLGLFIAEIRAGDRRISLDSDVTDAWRARDVEGWIDALAAITRERAPEDDDLFTRTRGPQSESLRRWLFEHVGAYDAVLVHESPFSTLPMAAEAAVECGVPCVVLPHLHVEDRYYHWQSHERAFRQAAMTLVAPAPAKPCYFDKLGGVESVVVPGGGVDPAEFAGDMQRRRAAFRKQYRSADPFVLVLGRKAGAKRYPVVIEAVRAARKTRPELRLVMIGPDEDRSPVHERFVSYLGPQPREVVLGALQECLLLASMSQGESFGIAILEAWMSGRPVAVDRSCLAFRDLVSHRRDGWLCATAAELKDAFLAALDAPDETRAMGERGRRRASGYDWCAVAAAVEAALDGAVAAGTRDRGESPTL